MVAAHPKAAARWRGVSALVRQSRMKLPVSSDSRRGRAELQERGRYGADIPVVGAPCEERNPLAVWGAGGMAFRPTVENQVGAPVGDSIKPMVSPAASCLRTGAGSTTDRFPIPQQDRQAASTAARSG